MIPKERTLERLVLDKLIDSETGVTYMDFVGTGITEDNIDQIVQNLRHGMFESEDDDSLKLDA